MPLTPGTRLGPYEIVAPLGAVPVQEGEEFRPGSPRKLFSFPRDVTGGAYVGDGNRTLVSIATGTRPRDIRLILDWTALIGR